MKKLFLFIFLFSSAHSYAQRITAEEYVAIYRDIAIAEMKRTGIPASITLAQGILETESGNSDLVKRSNNHFGIKCKSTWRGESVTHTDDAPNECFRKYAKAEDSYRDHSDYLRATPRYAFLFDLEADDHKGWCYGLRKAGYATNPRYPQILMGNIEKYNLLQYDKAGGFENNAQIPADLAFEKAAVIKPGTPSVPAEPDMLKGKVSYNSLKAIYAEKGTSLLAIAAQADLPLSKLMEYNDLDHDGLLKNEQWIYLERKKSAGNRDFHTSMQNETLYDVAQVNGVQLKILAELNNMSAHAKVLKGQKIRLRGSTASIRISAPAPALTTSR